LTCPGHVGDNPLEEGSMHRCLAVALFCFVVAIAAARDPQSHCMQVKEGLPLAQASVKGKYRNLLRVISVPQDKENYTEFREWGYYTGTEYYNHKNLPAGHWVYVYPRWYIWGDKAK
jgi:hypothetical protein